VPGQEGTLLWNRTFTPPEGPPDAATGRFGIGGMDLSIIDPEDGVFCFSESITRRWWGYDLNTGQQLWGPSDPEPSMNFYGMYENVYDGKLLSCGYGGKLVAYDIKTGEVLWEYTASQEGWESPYGNYPIGIAIIADGKAYLTSSEHSPTQPLWRGSYLRCVDLDTGEELWKINNWGLGMGPGPEGSTYIADGYIVTLNAYDNRIYCYGKGPSATTVTAAPKVTALGSSVLIEGMVTDQSPGAKDTPAIGDESMSEWMEYMYMQQPMPTNPEGVKVKLYSIDPNNNYQDIGTATTDMAGCFGISWVPPVPGDYWVVAEFEGSASYGSSYATTYFTVDEAPSAAQAIEPEPAVSTSTEYVPTVTQSTPAAESSVLVSIDVTMIAVALIAVIGIVAFLTIRKRK
jgi:outer membrane protein assembly factor BamB